MDSDMFITFVFHHRGKFIRDEDGMLIYADEEIDVWDDVDPDNCAPEDDDVRDMWSHSQVIDYEAHIYFEHQVDVPILVRLHTSKQSLGSIGVGRKTYDECKGDVHMEYIQHAAHVEDACEGDGNEDNLKHLAANNMSSFDDYESAEDSLYRPSHSLLKNIMMGQVRRMKEGLVEVRRRYWLQILL
ncbi:pollen-specific leucine-rich repeat extensin-like protein 1 [Sesbania bispinosa]|nr:pollen-specific leucine-rich repeat extensin-like protein 1 [Sesbania bispinosa]